MQAKKDLAFLQRSIEVSELFGPGTRDARLSEEVLLDSLGVTPTFSKNKIFVHIGVHIKMHIKL
jgi:hypothetical protein